MLLFALAGCAEKVSYTTPIPVDDVFERRPATGDLASRIARAAAYSEEHGGRAFMVVVGDVVVYESGQNGYTLDQPHHLYSGTKSFTCALFHSLGPDGLTAGQPVDDVLSTQTGATVDQLLHLTSGVRNDAPRLGWDFMRVEPRNQDIYALSLEQPSEHEPGTSFTYGPVDFNLFGAVVTARHGDPLTVLQQRVLEPIGLRTAGWLRDPSGNPALSLGAWTTANEWAKFGVLMRDDGMFLGERVLAPGLHDCFRGSEPNPAYGRTFWLNRDPRDSSVPGYGRRRSGRALISEAAPEDLVMAAGADDQRLYIVPSLDLVIVRLSDGAWRFDDEAQLAPFFEAI